MKVTNINSHNELLAELSKSKNAYLLLYKGDSEQSNCAKASLESVELESKDIQVYAADVAVTVTNRAMELMGSYGYVRDCDVEKYWRDCKIIQLWEGGAQLGRFDVCRAYYDLPL